MDETKQEVPEVHGLFIGTLISINCCLSGSIYGVPWAFIQSGWAFSILILAFHLINLILLGIILLQVLSRLEVISNYVKEGYNVTPVPFLEIFQDHPPSNYITLPIRTEISPLNPKRTIHNNKLYDYTIICKALLGTKVEKIFIIIMVAASFVQIVSSESSFASSFVSVVPIGALETCNIYNHPSFEDTCRYKYMFYIFILGIITAIITFILELEEQSSYILIVVTIRMCAIFTICFTSLYSLYKNQDFVTGNPINTDVKVFDFKGIGETFPVLFFALTFHNMIPDMMQPLKDKKENGIKMVIITLLVSSALILFISLGTIFAVNKPESLITLNWSNYSNGKKDREWWTYLLDISINLCPAIDATSILTVYINNISGNLLSLLNKGLEDSKGQNYLLVKIKFLVLVVTLAFSLVFYDQGALLSLSGNFFITITLIFIVLFSLASLKLVPQKCHYDNFLSSKSFLKPFLWFNVLIVFCAWAGFFISYFRLF
jgi:amino acid permease